MKITKLIKELLERGGVSAKAAEAMEEVAGNLLALPGCWNRDVIVEINEDTDKYIESVVVDRAGEVCLQIRVTKEDID